MLQSNNPRLPKALSALVLFLLSILFLYAYKFKIGFNFYEAGDAAKDSLYILQAKKLQLLAGNASRIGTWHPGPVIYYFLAFSELIFYDWFKVAASPFGGQWAGLALYTALWLWLAFHILHRMTASVIQATFGLAIFALSWIHFGNEFGIMRNIWMPDIPCLPFAVAVLALARLMGGYVDTLFIMVVAFGFCMNGHVCFIPILSLMLALGLVYNFIKFRHDETRRILGWPFWKAYKGKILLSIGILSLFFIPLLLRTILEFPGPIKGYFTFTRSHDIHSLHDVFKYVAYFWGGWVPMIIGLMATFLAYRLKFAHQALNGNFQNLLAIIFIATIAQFFYARYGVDYLIFTYASMFYYCIPALCITTLAMAVSERLFFSEGKVTLVLASSVLLALTYPKIIATGAGGWEHIPDMPALFQGLKQEQQKGDHNKRIVIDLDPTTEAPLLPATMEGLIIYEKRQSENFFCINEGWVFEFAQFKKCMPQEIKENTHYLWTGKKRGNSDFILEKAHIYTYRQSFTQ